MARKESAMRAVQNGVVGFPGVDKETLLKALDGNRNALESGRPGMLEAVIRLAGRPPLVVENDDVKVGDDLGDQHLEEFAERDVRLVDVFRRQEIGERIVAHARNQAAGLYGCSAAASSSSPMVLKGLKGVRIAGVPPKSANLSCVSSSLLHGVGRQACSLICVHTRCAYKAVSPVLANCAPVVTAS